MLKTVIFVWRIYSLSSDGWQNFTGNKCKCTSHSIASYRIVVHVYALITFIGANCFVNFGREFFPCNIWKDFFFLTSRVKKILHDFWRLFLWLKVISYLTGYYTVLKLFLSGCYVKEIAMMWSRLFRVRTPV